MEKKDVFLIALIILNIFLILDRFNFFAGNVNAQTVTYKKDIQTKLIGTNAVDEKYTFSGQKALFGELDALRINSNEIYVRGYDVFKIQLETFNLLGKKGLIYFKESQKILDSSFVENMKGEKK